MKKILPLLLLLALTLTVSCSATAPPPDPAPGETLGSMSQASVANLGSNAAWLSNDYALNNTYATTKAADVFGNAATLGLKNFFVNVGKFTPTATLIDTPTQIPTLLSTWSSSGTTADVFASLNGNISSISTGPDIHSATVRFTMVKECMKFVFYDDELAALPYGGPTTGYLGASHVGKPANPAHPGDVVRFQGCVWDLEASGAYVHQRVLDLRSLMGNAYFYLNTLALNTTVYKHDVYIFGLSLYAPATNASQWTGDDAISFLSAGVTGFAPGLYNSTISCIAIAPGVIACDQAYPAYTSWVESQTGTWLNVVNNYGNAYNGQKAKLWLGLPAFRTSGCSYYPFNHSPWTCPSDPKVETVARASDAVAAEVLLNLWPYSSLTGASIYVHTDGANASYAQYLSTSTWHDWPDYCSHWNGTNCDATQ